MNITIKFENEKAALHLVVTGCSDCPLNEYVGGPEQCDLDGMPRTRGSWQHFSYGVCVSQE
jgi:hypothetical protein